MFGTLPKPVRVTHPTLIASNGNKIRKATRVWLNDGEPIDFTENLSNKEAFKQANLYIQREWNRIYSSWAD